jgi:hypothetical protein
MSDSLGMQEWRRERNRRLRARECPCIICLPYPNQAEADRWRPGKPVPEGWQYEPGWGLTCTEEWLP